MVLGAKIKEARKQARLSQEQVAILADVDRSEISRLETDKVVIDWMRWGTIKRLCNVLKLSPYDFMEHENDRR